MKSAFEITLYYPSGHIREFHYPMPKNAIGTDTVLDKIRYEHPNAFCIVVSRNGKESQWINPNYRRVKNERPRTRRTNPSKDSGSNARKHV